MNYRFGIGAAVPFLAAAVLWGSGTTAWELNTYQDFVRGKFQGVSLSRDGRLMLAPKVDTLFTSDQPIVWSAARGPNGKVFVATGHRGRVFEVDAAGKNTLLWTAQQPEVFAIAVDAKGALYAGTSPNGKVYRIENGNATEFFDPKTRYIWSLAFGREGELYVGTGDQGKIFRVEAPGKGELWYDTGQANITGLAVDPQGRLLAGSEPNGILYRISGKDKAFVLYDASLPEVRAIVPSPDGTVYVAALGGSVAKRQQGANQAVQSAAGATQVTAPATTITVEASANAQTDQLKVPPDPSRPPAQPQPATQVTTQFQPVVDLAGVEKSALYRVNPDNTVETLWTSKEENIYDILTLPNQVLFCTDGSGRIYGISRDRRVTLVLQTNEAETTRLLPGENSVLAATGNMGRIYQLGQAPGTSGTYESPVHDANTAARWGSLSWRADVSAGTTLRFRTRTGNSARPDRTWSEWSEPLADPNGSKVSSPNARYIQWKAEFTGSNGASPVLTNVTAAYLPQNLPPVVKTILVTAAAAGASAAAAKPAQTQPMAAYTVTVTDTGDASATSSGTPSQTLSRGGAQQINLTWQAEDPDGDRLVYTVYFRGDDERQWKLLKGNLHENTVTFDGDVLADGKYFFRVTASDREANPPGIARDAELVSSPVIIDNTPPAITVGAANRQGATAEILFDAFDTSSALRRCEYSLDASSWTPIESQDGVIDSQRERFVLKLENLSAGEHLVVLRAVDSANNTGLAKVVLR